MNLSDSSRPLRSRRHSPSTTHIALVVSEAQAQQHILALGATAIGVVIAGAFNISGRSAPCDTGVSARRASAERPCARPMGGPSDSRDDASRRLPRATRANIGQTYKRPGPIVDLGGDARTTATGESMETPGWLERFWGRRHLRIAIGRVDRTWRLQGMGRPRGRDRCRRGDSRRASEHLHRLSGSRRSLSTTRSARQLSSQRSSAR